MMIGVLYPQRCNSESDSQIVGESAGPLVLAAVRRSVSQPQAQPLSLAGLNQTRMLVVVDIPDCWGDILGDWLASNKTRKLVVLGRMPASLYRRFGWGGRALPDLSEVGSSVPAPAKATARSRAEIVYGERAERLGASGWRRPFERFDFADEWNNLGFGAVRCVGDKWSIAHGLETYDDEVAAIHIDGLPTGSFVALHDAPGYSVLWINRPVGFIDSYEWRMLEHFWASYRAATLPCQPVIREIPFGYDACITSRLDCDEDVESARPLWEAYKSLNVPFSLAVHTTNLRDSAHHPILRELVACDEALLSHTATHAPNWGGTYERAFEEGRRSMEDIFAVTGQRVRYAVSPFHQSPDYALDALSDVGYEGCIGGLIRNDPAFLIARGGPLNNLPHSFIGHSQQCMMHGDCLLEEGDALATFKCAFDQAYQTATLFGYLDHPFSPRYSYGWSTEHARIDAHTELIAYIRQVAAKPLFLNENQAMDFLRLKSSLSIFQIDNCGDAGAEMRFTALEGGMLPAVTLRDGIALGIAVEFCGRVFAAASLAEQRQ